METGRGTRDLMSCTGFSFNRFISADIFGKVPLISDPWQVLITAVNRISHGRLFIVFIDC